METSDDEELMVYTERLYDPFRPINVSRNFLFRCELIGPSFIVIGLIASVVDGTCVVFDGFLETAGISKSVWPPILLLEGSSRHMCL